MENFGQAMTLHPILLPTTLLPLTNRCKKFARAMVSLRLRLISLHDFLEKLKFVIILYLPFENLTSYLKEAVKDCDKYLSTVCRTQL